ncbi:MAG: LytTR family transcriptional regulator DNA-binding domain-containing protein [Negativicutes bacterium]|nr:LytTR family transcriptional regulator DNA-binding domain-containing protein [Negativicutes bacterium]
MNSQHKKIRTIIVDDETHARTELQYLLEQHADVQIVCQSANVKDALPAIERLQPHLVFLDIRMPGMDGMQAAEKIMENVRPPLLVFATAHEEFAVKAFELNAVDYLLKPFSAKRVDRCIGRVRSLLADAAQIDRQKFEPVNRPVPQRKLAIEVNGKAMILNMKDIVLAYCSDGQLTINTTEKTYVTNMTLQDLQLKLDEELFFRSHRAYLVNVEKIREVIPWFNGTYNLVLEGMPDKEIPVSRQNSPQLKKMFGL